MTFRAWVNTSSIKFGLSCVEVAGNKSLRVVPLLFAKESAERMIYDGELVFVSGSLRCMTGGCAVVGNISQGIRLESVSAGSVFSINVFLTPRKAYYYRQDGSEYLPRFRGGIECALEVVSEYPFSNRTYGFVLEDDGGCANGVWDVGEDSVDCGGVCEGCPCLRDSDCGVDRYVGRVYCNNTIDKSVKLYRMFECVKSLWSRPYCTQTEEERVKDVTCEELY